MPFAARTRSTPTKGGTCRNWKISAYYRLLTLSCVPAYLALIIWAGDVFVSAPLNMLGQLGWLLSIGTVGGLIITVAHELIHKDDELERLAGGFLLAQVFYGGFKVEHIRGHHVHVSTPEDASSPFLTGRSMPSCPMPMYTIFAMPGS